MDINTLRHIDEYSGWLKGPNKLNIEENITLISHLNVKYPQQGDTELLYYVGTFYPTPRWSKWKTHMNLFLFASITSDEEVYPFFVVYEKAIPLEKRVKGLPHLHFYTMELTPKVLNVKPSIKINTLFKEER